MTRLSVNINKIATIRNARGGNNPDLVKVAKDCERFGAEGITVHPRPDERHITYSDVMDLKDVISTEFNIEGYPDDRYIDIIRVVKPIQATLVPDPPDVLTSNAGWDTIKNKEFLKEVITEIKKYTDRVSLFIETDNKMIEGAANAGADRIELYTESYANNYQINKAKSVIPYIHSSEFARKLSLGVNAGHDLNLENLRYLKESLPYLDEVSIGHALICDAIYYGLENSIQMYLEKLHN
jgi:pyridoxine 5-phosphate synthase